MTETANIRQAAHLAFGGRGETAAAGWYVANGYEVLDRNWRRRGGELDLVAATGSLVAFIEVKSRSSSRFGTGAEAVDWRKQRRIRSLATQWLQSQDQHYQELRFDVVDVDARGALIVHEGCF